MGDQGLPALIISSPPGDAYAYATWPKYRSALPEIRVFELWGGRVFVQPGSLEPGASGGGKFGLGIPLECSDEAIERTGAVLDAIEWKRSADLGNDPPTTGNAAILFHKVSPAARRSSDICRWCV
jgi:hypothetical protein